MKKNLMSSMALFALFTLTAMGCDDSASKKSDEPAKPAAAPAPAPAPAPSPEPAAAAPAPAAAPAAADTAITEAKQVFTTRCVACHGASGHGDGAAAASLKPKPANYSDPAWQKSVTDQQIANAIVKGGAAVGKSPLMPPNADLAEKQAVVKELVKMIRAFGAAK